MTAKESQTYAARFQQIRAIDPEMVLTRERRPHYAVSHLHRGDVFRLRTKTYRVTGVSQYREMDDNFRKTRSHVSTEFELFCLETGDTAYLEWSRDDDLEVSISERKLNATDLTQLFYDTPERVYLDDIDEIVEEEETLRFGGKSYPYDDDWSASWTSGDGRSGHVYIAEFGTEQNGWLSIEGWSDDGKKKGDWDYEVWLSVTVSPREVEILVLGGGKDVRE